MEHAHQDALGVALGQRAVLPQHLCGGMCSTASPRRNSGGGQHTYVSTIRGWLTPTVMSVSRSTWRMNASFRASPHDLSTWCSLHATYCGAAGHTRGRRRRSHRADQLEEDEPARLRPRRRRRRRRRRPARRARGVRRRPETDDPAEWARGRSRPRRGATGTRGGWREGIGLLQQTRVEVELHLTGVWAGAVGGAAAAGWAGAGWRVIWRAGGASRSSCFFSAASSAAAAGSSLGLSSRSASSAAAAASAAAASAGAGEAAAPAPPPLPLAAAAAPSLLERLLVVVQRRPPLVDLRLAPAELEHRGASAAAPTPSRSATTSGTAAEVHRLAREALALGGAAAGLRSRSASRSASRPWRRAPLRRLAVAQRASPTSSVDRRARRLRAAPRRARRATPRAAAARRPPRRAAPPPPRAAPRRAGRFAASCWRAASSAAGGPAVRRRRLRRRRRRRLGRRARRGGGDRRRRLGLRHEEVVGGGRPRRLRPARFSALPSPSSRRLAAGGGGAPPASADGANPDVDGAACGDADRGSGPIVECAPRRRGRRAEAHGERGAGHPLERRSGRRGGERPDAGLHRVGAADCL